MDKAYMWDLTTLYKDDNAWREALGGVDEKITAVSAFQGKLTDADHVLAYFKADTDLSLLLSDLFCYASLRRSEDTRAADAQAMYAQIYGKYVQAVSATAFAEPEILALPEETLKSLTDDPKLKESAELASGMIKAKLTLNLAGQEVGTVSADELAQFVTMNEETYEVTLDQEALNAWVENLAASYNTVESERTYTREDGKVITVSGGVYGWEVDTEALRDAIIDSRKQTVACLFDLKVVPKTMTDGYGSWWNVGMAMVSDSESVRDAAQEVLDRRAEARKY